MLEFIDFSTFGDPRRAKANFYVSIGLALVAAGLFFGFHEKALALSCVGMILTLWMPSGHGVPVDSLPPAPPKPVTSTDATVRDMPALRGPDPSTIVGCLLLAATCFACGPSTYLKRQQVAGEIQEESVKAQAAAADRLIKLAWFSCNAWTDRDARGAQAVLDARVDVAKGVAGAADKQTAAEAQADKLHKVMGWACDFARDTDALLKGVPLDVLPALPPAPPPASSPAAPAAPAPAVPTPPVVVPQPAPVALPSPLQPPAPPVVPAAPAVP